MPKLTYICDHGETYHTCHPEIPVRLFLRFCLFSAHLRTWICHLSCRYLALDAQFAFHNLNLGKCDLRIFQEDGFVQDPMNQREQALQPKKRYAIHTSTRVTLAALAMTWLKFRDVLRKMTFPSGSPLQPFIRAKSPPRAISMTYSTLLNVLT